MVFEKKYLVARPATKDYHLTLIFEDGSQIKYDELGVINKERHNEDKCTIIHLIATRPKFRKQGLAAKLIQSVFSDEKFQQIE